VKVRAKHVGPGIIIISILGLVLCPLLSDPRLFSSCQDIDLNSGDIRVQVNVCFMQVKNEIQTTPFSREVRRLGIAVPQERRWVRRSTEVIRVLYKGCIYYSYGRTFSQCKTLMMIFKDGDVPDAERAAIMQKILTHWQSRGGGELRMVDEELQALAKKVYAIPAQ